MLILAHTGGVHMAHMIYEQPLTVSTLQLECVPCIRSKYPKSRKVLKSNAIV